EVPYLGSLILTHSLDGAIKGLKEFKPEDRPPVAIPFFAFRIMVGIGLAGPLRSKPHSAARLSLARDHGLAIHPRRRGPVLGFSGRVFPRQLLSRTTWRRRSAARPLRRLQEQRRALSRIPSLFSQAQAAVSGSLGQERPVFLPQGAEAFKRDIPDADVRFF